MDSQLLKVTKEMLLNKDRDLTYKDIADATTISESWLRRFASRKGIGEPSVVTIEKLYNFLSGKQLGKQLAA